MKIIGPQTGEELFRDWGKRIASLEATLGALSRDKTYPSNQRPDPTNRPGARIFDIGLGLPLWSDGTNWVTAGGTPVTGVSFPGRIFVGPTMPAEPTGTEYVWFKTDGNGVLVDTIVGIT